MSAAKITRQSKSNLALAFISLGRERKRDITVFYAFCRVIDDIADSADFDATQKQSQLAAWREMVRGARAGEPLLAREERSLIDKYSLPLNIVEEIIAGVEMDLSISRYATFEELRLYCYRVASAVGLVSIEIFGYRNARCKEYALELGLALQMTKQEDLARFSYSEKELQDRQHNERFVRLMEFEAARSREFFSRAAAALPSEDRRTMVPAEIMSSIYRGLLRRMELDQFRVFEKEYRLSGLEKAGRLAAQLIKIF